MSVSDIGGKCDGQDISFLQRLCTHERHFWVCLVSTTDEYESLQVGNSMINTSNSARNFFLLSIMSGFFRTSHSFGRYNGGK